MWNNFIRYRQRRPAANRGSFVSIKPVAYWGAVKEMGVAPVMASSASR